ncbi:MAG TPA: sigma-70 family RNA polymerase sigma factor [Polyangia bacterium]|nr:sigma-70 family RNA polymerase sigma factor [Polyangia bacterium]
MPTNAGASYRNNPIYGPRRVAERTPCRPGTTTRGTRRKKETRAGPCATLEANAPGDVAKSVGFAGDGEIAVADHSTIGAYLHELRAYPLMTREEEHDTVSKNADSALAARLVTANLRLVVKNAQEYRRQHDNLLDLIQEGNLGLIHAVEKYDPNRGVKLSSYASWWIRAYILKVTADWSKSARRRLSASCFSTCARNGRSRKSRATGWRPSTSPPRSVSVSKR